jgi:CubicO group peptidase (beta-lactamase class C family)
VGRPTELPVRERNLDGIAFEAEGRRQTIAEFIETNDTDGFIVLHQGMIITELYRNGMTRRTAHLSQSVAKSIVGTVAGILIGREQLDPLSPVTRYLPELDATAYRGASVQQVLDMTSGVAWDETYTAADSHMAQMDAACGWKDRANPAWPRCMWDLIATLRTRECPHGASFRYRSIETDVLGFILQRASGGPLAELVSQTLWSPMGAEEDAYFTIDPAGFVCACGGFNATLRDYARFAQVLVGEGEIGGRRIVPRKWIAETRQANHVLFGASYREVLPRGAYHNQFWIEDPERRALIARGVFGQLIYIDPESQFAAVKLSSWPDFLNAQRTKTALAAVRSIRDALCGTAGPATPLGAAR